MSTITAQGLLRLLALSYARLVASPKWSRELQLPMTKGSHACGKSLDGRRDRLCSDAAFAY
jgi:hypothetical protein